MLISGGGGGGGCRFGETDINKDMAIWGMFILWSYGEGGVVLGQTLDMLIL